MPRIYRRRKKPNSVRGFVDDMTKNKIINSAAKIAAKQSNATEEARELKKVDPELRQSVANFLRYRLDMTEQEFLNQVNSKLSNMVGDSLNILHSKLDDIPPQNLAYAVSIIMDKFLTVSGRPSNITASANVTLGHVTGSSTRHTQGCIQNSQRTTNRSFRTKGSPSRTGR